MILRRFRIGSISSRRKATSKMWRSCPRCGKIHSTKYKCTAGKEYRGGIERRLRSSYSWTQKSEEIREKASYLCEVCKDEGEIVYKDIEVHHIEKIKDAPGEYLNNYNLISLCQEHHKAADAGEISKDYLRKLAYHREETSSQRPEDAKE